jgi:crotonobetainyl-CoA:carnitine CoA-transferase CaiB-like acyl-CoA transferase
MEGVLAGLRVLDFSTLLPGPMATLFLADAGAEVIKIENPTRGDEMRSYVPRWGADSVNFHLLNRGKKSVALDLKSPEDGASLRSLLESADILVEQYRPGVMARLRLSYEEVRAIKPDIIYCSISGYGQNGPRHMRAGHDLNYQGDTGLLALSNGTVEAPVVPPALIADIAGGTYPALVNIVLALWRRERTGEGSYIDIAMADNLFPFLYWAQGEGQVDGKWPGNGNSLVTGGACRYRLYATADGRLAAVAAIEQKFWEKFCEAIGLEAELRDDSADRDATAKRVTEIIGSRSSEHWERIFDAADCCCSVVRTLQEAMSDPQFEVRGLFARRIAGPDGAEMPALPTPIVPGFRAKAEITPSAPKLGENTRDYAVLRKAVIAKGGA